MLIKSVVASMRPDIGEHVVREHESGFERISGLTAGAKRALETRVGRFGKAV